MQPSPPPRARPRLPVVVPALAAVVLAACGGAAQEPFVDSSLGAAASSATTTTDDPVVSPPPSAPDASTSGDPGPSDPGPSEDASPDRTASAAGGATSDEPAQSDPDAEDEGGDVSVAGVPDRVIDAVLAAASDHAGVDSADVAVVVAQRVTFRDGSLDCPVPGRQYTQALVDGYRVVVEASGDRLDYRMALQGEPRLCVGGGTPLPPADV